MVLCIFDYVYILVPSISFLPLLESDSYFTPHGAYDQGYAVTLNDACRSGVKVILHHSMILFKRMHVYFIPIWFILYITRA